MDITVQNQTEQALMHRKDFQVRVFSKGSTPSRAKLLDALAKELKAKKELLIVRKIGSIFGDTASIVDVSVYADDASLKEFEPTYMQTRHEKALPKEEPKEEAPAADASAEEKTEEKPAEEAKDVPKEEPKEEAPAEKKEGDA